MFSSLHMSHVWPCFVLMSSNTQSACACYSVLQPRGSCLLNWSLSFLWMLDVRGSHQGSHVDCGLWCEYGNAELLLFIGFQIAYSTAISHSHVLYRVHVHGDVWYGSHMCMGVMANTVQPFARNALWCSWLCWCCYVTIATCHLHMYQIAANFALSSFRIGMTLYIWGAVPLYVCFFFNGICTECGRLSSKISAE